MLKKSIGLLTIFFLLQTIISCFTCPDIERYNVHYTGVRINAYNTSGFMDELVLEGYTVFKNAFGITVEMITEIEQIAQIRLPSNSLSFQSAYALQPCDPDEYVYVDNIENLRIFAAESDTSEVLDFTARFGTFDYQGNIVSVEEILARRGEGDDGFQLQLIDFDNMTDNLMFKVEVTTESGNVYEAKTPVIHFFKLSK